MTQKTSTLACYIQTEIDKLKGEKKQKQKQVKTKILHLKRMKQLPIPEDAEKKEMWGTGQNDDYEK